MPLCKRCEHFDIKNFLSNTDGCYFVIVKDVIAGYIKNCDFCSILVKSLFENPSGYETKWIEMKLYDSQKELNSEDLPRLTRNLGIVALVATVKDIPVGDSFSISQDGGLKVAQFAIAADKASPAALSGTIKGRFLGQDTSSLQSLATVLEWIKDCMHNHPKCNGPEFGKSAIRQLPNRCLEVTEKIVRLVETKGQTGSYLILSHRWTRKTAECNTTVMNYQERLKRISFEDLIPAFKDAITIAIKLQVRYLWIDTLCIIQSGDDGQDTSKEILNMCEYYQNAMATICATTQMPENHGLFVCNRELPFKKIARLPFQTSSGEKKGYFYVLDRPLDWLEDFQKLVRYDDVMTRGWIFQEWLLSRRVIYYTSIGPIFECNTNLPVMETQLGLNPPFTSQYKAFIQTADRKPLEYWYYLLKSYCQLTLSEMSTDRIAAIAGVAKSVRDLLSQNRTGLPSTNPCCEYVSGLWLQDIHHGLLWIKFDHKDYVKVEGYPTWSWASVGNRISWEHYYDLYNRYTTKKSLTINALITRDYETYSVTTGEDGIPTSVISDRDQQTISIGPFDIDNKFTTLKVSARICPLLVRDHIEIADIYKITSQSGLSLSRPYYEPQSASAFVPDKSDPHIWYSECEPWFKICDPQEPSIYGGWAAIERPNIRFQLKHYAGTLLTGIHVSTVTGIKSGVRYNTLSTSADVYNVLFVEHLGAGYYERVGVGQVFETSITKQFKKVETTDIILV